MKRLIMIIVILVWGTNTALAIDALDVVSVSANQFTFDYLTEYLDVNVVGLDPPSASSPSWWDRLWGKKTDFGLIYIEFQKDGETRKIPLFSYSAKADNSYEIDKVGVLDSSIAYPVIQKIPYAPDNVPNLRLVIRYWEDPMQADLIKSIISAAHLLGGMETAAVDKALGISTTVVSLIEELWPSDDKKSSVTLSLIKQNIAKDAVTFGYPKNDGSSHDAVITIGFGKKNGYFVGKSFNSALNDYSPDKLDVWRGSIIKLDNNLAATGINPLLNQLDDFSKYISTLPLNYADKVLLLANAIDSWATNSVNGVTDANGQKIKFTMAQYRRLRNSDWLLLDRLSNNVLEEITGWQNCKTPACRKLADFISKASVGLDVAAYIPPRVSINIGGSGINLSHEEFKSKVVFLNDTSWDNFSLAPGADNRWVADFEKGRLKIEIDSTAYKENSIKMTLLKAADNYYIQAIEIH